MSDFLTTFKDTLRQVITDNMVDLTCDERLDVSNYMVEFWEAYRADVLGTMAGVKKEM